MRSHRIARKPHRFRPTVLWLDRLQMLDASQAMTLPIGLTTAELSSPKAMLDALPVATPVIATSAPDPAVPPIAGSAVAASDLRKLPTIAPLKSTQAATIRLMRLQPVLASNAETMLSSIGSSQSGTDSTSSGGSGSSSSGGASSSSGGGTGSTPTPGQITDTVSDSTGDTATLTIDYSPNPDGTFSFDLSITWSFGSPPAQGSTIADDSTNTNSSTGSFDLNIAAGLQTTTIMESEHTTDTYNINDTLTAQNASGTWTDFGHDSSDLTDTFTLNADGTGSQSYSTDSNSSAKYNLTESGSGFNYTCSGNDSTSNDQSGSDASNGTGSGTDTANDTATETVTLDVSGAAVSGNAKSTLIVGYQDNGSSSPGASSNTATTTDNGSDTVNVTVSDPGPARTLSWFGKL